MTAIELIKRLHQHRIWVNAQLLTAAGELTHKQLHQPLAIGQGTAWKTLTHLMGAEYVWLEALLGNESPTMPGDKPGMLPGNQQGDDAIASLDELSLRWNTLDGRWCEYLDSLTEASLDEIVHKVSTSSGAGKSFANRRADILLHVCTHAQYTTAQLVNMFRQLGQTDLPDAMLITLAREEDSA